MQTLIKKDNYNPSDIYRLTDLTLLNELATKEQILNTLDIAYKNQVAAICLYPENFIYIPTTQNILKATVVNFPSGNMQNTEVIHDIENVIKHYNVDEIDYVFPYQQYLNNSQNKSFDSCAVVLETCQKYNKTLKVIIESGAFSNFKQIYNLSLELAKIGCNFIKTSTGKISNGASPEAALAILNAIKDSNKNCGIKISGGIRTFEQANIYIKLAEHILKKKVTPAWFRIGSSKLT